MKRFLILFLIITSSVCFGQAKIGMVQTYTVIPNDTVDFNDVVTLLVTVTNTGDAPYTGSFQVLGQRDTIAGLSCGSSSLNVTNFQPGATLQTSLTFTATQGATAFSISGNGNTIVVWPMIIDALPGDSVRPIVWITQPTGIDELASNYFKVYPNPIADILHIEPLHEKAYKKIIVYDVFARKVKEIPFEKEINLSDLKPGLYWIIINSDNGSYRMPIIKEGIVVE